MTRHHQRGTTRRDVLKAAGALAAGYGAASLVAVPADATPDAMQAAIRQVIGEAPVKPGKVTLEIPPLVENGNTVPCSVTVDSPMTANDHVKAVHIFNEKNPQPNVLNVQLGPRAGKARVSTRIRLADTQTVVAIAQMNDGSFWSGSAHVIVTLPACVEESQP
jgi:sulfur-oxidizing protein SoxY